MHRLRWLLALFILISVNVYATRLPNHDKPTTFLGPTLRLTYAGWFTDTAAYSVLGEAAGSNFRISGTAGFKFSPVQRLKFTAEYLWQDITYSFLAGNNKSWVDQGAIGADYQYDFGQYYDVTLDISAYASHAPSQTLNTVSRTYVRNGIVNSFTNSRRIAGSNAAGISPGLDFVFWEGGNAGIDLNYDNVHYDVKYGHSQQATGFGGTAHIDQQIGDNVVLGLAVAIRRPFNLYQANLNWDNLYYYGRWGLGLWGEYTAGKEALPSTYNAGFSINYFADRITCITPTPQNYKGEIDYKAELPVIASPVDQAFLNWVNDPAVYMPQVLAIVDQRTGCTDGAPPVLVATIPGQVISTAGAAAPIPLAPYFSGSGITYSFTVTPAPSSGDSISVDPNTGVLSVTNGGGGTRSYSITVTATNSCGSASGTFSLVVFSLG